jgi:hypothetical protein
MEIAHYYPGFCLVLNYIVCYAIMKATKYFIDKVKYFDGSTASMVIWELPQPTKERPHGYKYRLNYYAIDGITLVRYDNSHGHGKGDHKHILDKIYPYKFISVEKLLSDFKYDTGRIREKTK